MVDREQLRDWVRQQHAGQLIKYTDKPYFEHLEFVAEKAGNKALLAYEIGLCHDLFEETKISAGQLMIVLSGFGYGEAEVVHITDSVTELTDKFTKKVYPDLKKAERKRKEAERLAHISPDAQTVKYGDLIYNINWVLNYESTAKKEKYLRKKRALLNTMTKGDPGLRAEALKLLHQDVIIKII
ncbi:hypothetical protein GCM10023149_24200 [Mucilaginibacter gynuensis]|uniref:HD domain-containing protein n=1 Tax=Mucilaginibacter gynuensis TaxID=1302236 RepID=A0ABP8GFI5_9SPHI